MKNSQGKKDRVKKCCNEMLIQPERSDCPPGGSVPQNNASVWALGGGGGGLNCPLNHHHLIQNTVSATAAILLSQRQYPWWILWACISTVYFTTPSDTLGKKDYRLTGHSKKSIKWENIIVITTIIFFATTDSVLSRWKKMHRNIRQTHELNIELLWLGGKLSGVILGIGIKSD